MYGPLKYTDELLETVEAWNGKIGAPDAENRKKNRLRVFQNRFVEDYLATSHPLLPGLWFGGFILYGLVVPFTSDLVSIPMGLGLYALGVLGWTLLEYVLHRWAFHFDPGDSPMWRMNLFLMHGYHHEFPNDKRRLVAPPMLSWPLAVIVGGTYYLLLGPDKWLCLFGGTTAGYLAYDWVHYYTHHGRPKGGVGRLLRRAHMVHHYKLFHVNMGISSPLWDHLLGSWAWSDDAIKEAMTEARSVENGPGSASVSPPQKKHRAG